jgi:3-deoxy-D-manno-octulosonic-acid transferase
MRLIYDFVIRLLTLGIQMAAFFHPKAKRWVQGRKDWRRRLKTAFAALVQSPNEAQSPLRKPVLWLHAASLGEFEQGRPILESFRSAFPDWKIVLTFFSPSGYEVRKNYPHADLICYLPADTRSNARDFLQIIQPDVAIFVKYEFWGNYLFELKKRKTTTLLVSALFRTSQPFFKWYGAYWRKMLGCYAHIFVQNEASAKLLQSIDIQNISITGDTRVDRVLKIAKQAPENEIVKAFVGADASQVLVMGSSWEADEAVVFRALQLSDPDSFGVKPLKLIIAPHEPSNENVDRIGKQLGNCLRYSRCLEVTPLHGEVSPPNSACLIIDNIGLLNTIYRYGSIAYIGGGFGKGIHNTLEPAAFGLPIIFGPKYEKFEEARQFVARGGAFSVQNAEEITRILTQLQDPVFYQTASRAVLDYLEESRGATEEVMRYLERKCMSPNDLGEVKRL